VDDASGVECHRTEGGIVLIYPAAMPRDIALALMDISPEELRHSWVAERSESDALITETIAFR
jgi:hypothetical protein